MKQSLCLGFFAVIWSFMLFPAFSAEESKNDSRQSIKPFRLDQVRLQPSPFKKAQDKDAAYLLSVEPDRLLAKFRTNAGLEPKAEHYGGWEMKTIAGHSLGHYLSALSFMYASTGDSRFKERADYIVDELATCQKAGKDGLVSAIEGIREKFDDVSRGEIRTHGFDLNGLWVPWYAQHKVYAGLIDAYRYCNNERALEVAKKLGDWGIEITKNLSDEQFQNMLRCEFGGMNESYYDLYALTGEEKYLKMGDRFYHHAILDPLREGRDELKGKHANTQIPKLVGLARRYEIKGDELSAKETVDYFWNRVVNHHSYVTGSNSMGEHFGEPDKLNDRLRDDTAETCNTYNMLKLSKMLYTWTGEQKYMDYFERALFNHILPSIDLSDDPNKLFTYFVPLRSGGFRTYSSPNRVHEEQGHHWSCCHGTGMENHGLYNGMIYYHGTEDGKDVLYVNLLIPSTLDWKEKGVRVTIADDCNIRVNTTQPIDLIVKVRAPNNSTDNASKDKVDGNYYLAGSSWKNGETTIHLPFVARWKTESMPDNEGRIAFFHGPYLFVGNIGPIDKPIAGEFANPSADKVQIPVIVTDSTVPASMIQEVSQGKKCPCCTEKIECRLVPALPAPVPMVPFYEASQRYAVYFDKFTEEGWKDEQVRYQAEQKRIAKENALSVDFFQPGEMQPERDHDFKGEKSDHGIHMDRKWRTAHDGGFMEFDMKVDPQIPCKLLLTYWGDDNGNREFDILIDGKKIATQVLDFNAPGKFFDVSHEIDNLENKDKIRVRLQAHPGKIAGGLFGAKTVRRAGDVLELDSMQPGDEAQEKTHDFKSDRSNRGEAMDRSWRDAHDTGYMEFDMKVDPKANCKLILTYWGSDAGNREFDILVDGNKVGTQKLEHNRPGRFFDESYDIPNPEDKEKVRVRIQAHPGKIAGGIFGVKTVGIMPE